MHPSDLLSRCAMIPTPIEGEGGGEQNPTCRIPLFFAWNPWDSDPTLEWNCKVTFINKPWALVRKYLPLAPEELSASGGAKRKYDHGSANFWRDAIPTHVLLQSDMRLAPEELSASI